MPHSIFLAHSRIDRTAVAALVRAMRALGYAVALDDLLPGGSRWWGTVLERIERCEVFAYAVSGSSLDSEACRAQHSYASSLGLPALPVVVGEGVADALVPPELARLQRVDYRSASKQAMAELYRSIESLEAPSLREVESPGIPRGFDLDLTAAIGVDYLDPDAQAAIVAQLERLVAGGVTSGEVGDVLTSLRARDDLTVRADERLAALSTVAERTGRAIRLTSDTVPRDPAQQPRGARRVFVSYSRSDVEAVGVLAEDLRDAGFDVWLDRELPGGIEWWNEILRRIRECDAFVVAASAASRASRACAAELEYAGAVQRPVIGVAIEPGPTAGADLAYREASADELAGVISALRSAQAPQLPATLPPPPPVPASYLFDTRTEIRSTGVLKPAEQMALIEQLGHHLEGDISPRDILRLTAELRTREDLTVEAARALSAIEEEAEAAAARSGEPPEPARMAAPAAQPEELEPEPEPAGEPTEAGGASDAAGRPPEPGDAAEPAPPVTSGATGDARPRRRGRRVVVAAAVVAAAVAGAAVVGSALQDDDADASDAFDTTVTTAPFTVPPTAAPPSTVPASTSPPTSPPGTAGGTEATFQDITGTSVFAWVLGGVTYAATLTADGPAGVVHVGYLNVQGGMTVIHQDLELREHAAGWAYVGSSPRLADGTPATFYAPDVFFLNRNTSGWYVEQVCDSTGACALPQY